MNIKEILSQFEIYTDADDAARQKIEARAKLVRFRDGDSVSRQGQNINEVMLLGSGQIRVFLIGPVGREVTLYRLSPGEICTGNVLAAMNGGIAYTNAVASGSVEMVTVPVSEFKTFFAASSAVQDRIFKDLSERTETLLSLIEGITFVRMESRVADYLIKQSISDEDGKPIVKTTHASIAADIGSAREVVSRVLKNFRTRGAVEVARKKIKLLRKGLLEDIRAYN